MGVRGEVFSSTVSLPNRTYFFNVKENRLGDLYLNIVESKNRDSGGFDRQSVILFADDLQEFLKGFDESLRVMEKAAREKRHSKKGDPKRNDTGDEKAPRFDRGGRGDRSGRGNAERGARGSRGNGRSERGSAERGSTEHGGRGNAGRAAERGSRGSGRGERGGAKREGDRGQGGKRVVVRKKFNG